MRVAHVITRLILGGAQENTVLNCEDLIRQYRDDVLLITGPAIGPEGTLIDQARGRGIPLAIIPSLRRAIHPARDLKSYSAIKGVLQKFRPDVVHTHSAKGGLLGRLAASSLRVPAIIHTVHGAPFHKYQGRGARSLFTACELWAARKCDALISVADAMTDLLVDAGVAPREKFTTIYSGMEVEPFLNADIHRARMRETYGFRPEHVVIGKIARLFHLKGHEFLVQAAVPLVRHCPHARFLLVGDGVLRDAIQRQIQDAGLEDYFFFAGLIPSSEVPSAISAMDIVVHTSLREGLARVLPQSLIAGRPVVSFDIDGAREVVTSNETGLLVTPCHVPELTARLTELALNPQLRSRLGREGQRRCAEPFRHENMTAQIRQLYEHVLAAKSKY